MRINDIKLTDKEKENTLENFSKVFILDLFEKHKILKGKILHSLWFISDKSHSFAPFSG